MPELWQSVLGGVGSHDDSPYATGLGVAPVGQSILLLRRSDLRGRLFRRRPVGGSLVPDENAVGAGGDPGSGSALLLLRHHSGGLPGKSRNAGFHCSADESRAVLVRNQQSIGTLLSEGFFKAGSSVGAPIHARRFRAPSFRQASAGRPADSKGSRYGPRRVRNPLAQVSRVMSNRFAAREGQMPLILCATATLAMSRGARSIDCCWRRQQRPGRRARSEALRNGSDAERLLRRRRTKRLHA